MGIWLGAAAAKRYVGVPDMADAEFHKLMRAHQVTHHGNGRGGREYSRCRMDRCKREIAALAERQKYDALMALTAAETKG